MRCYPAILHGVKVSKINYSIGIEYGGMGGLKPTPNTTLLFFLICRPEERPNMPHSRSETQLAYEIPELNTDLLVIQLPMFRLKYPCYASK